MKKVGDEGTVALGSSFSLSLSSKSVELAGL